MRKTGALVATFIMTMCLTGTAQAIPTTTEIEGSLSQAENTCVSPIQFFQFNYFQLCSYSGGVDILSVVTNAPSLDFHNWMGPNDSGGFYPKGTLISPRTDGGFSGSTIGDSKERLPFTGTITIEDFGTEEPGDDKISGALIIGAGERGVSTSAGNAVEQFDAITHTLPATVAHSVTPRVDENDVPIGGFVYVIGSQGFPKLLESAAGPYPSETASITTDSPAMSTPTDGFDFNAWDVASGGNIILPPYAAPPQGGFVPHSVEIVSFAPGAANNSNVEPNIGMKTTAVVTNLVCVSGDADSTPDMTNPNPPDLPELIDDCNPDPAIGAGATWNVSGAEFDNLILRVSTNANKKVVSAEAFYTLEYKIESLNLNGGKPGSWIGGTLELFSLTIADDDRAKTPPGTPIDINILANDVGFTDDVEIAIVGGDTSGGTSVSGAIVTINGPNPGPQAGINVTYDPSLLNFEGEDTFEYTINDSTALPVQTAAVNVKVTEVIAPEATITTGEGQPVSINVGTLPGVRLGTAPITVVASQPGSGTTTVTGQIITYTQALFPASDVFSYQIQNSQGKSDTGTIFINIDPQLKPTANADTATVIQGESSVNIPVKLNDLAGSGSINDHTITILKKFVIDLDDPEDPDDGRAGVNGDAVVEADGTVTYTPDPGAAGVQTFQYMLTDVGGTQGPDVSAPTTVTITVEKQEITITLPDDSSSAIGPWSLVLLTVVGWLRRHRRFYTTGWCRL